MCNNYNHNHNHSEKCEHGTCHHEHHHEHHHHSHDGCSCGHDHGKEPEKGEKLELLIGGGLFAAGVLLHMSAAPVWLGIAVLAIAYLWLGGEVLLHAARNITQGHIFDENFLMSIATLGAFAIQEYPEAVGVMLFYRIGEYFENKAVTQSRKQIMAAVDMRPEAVLRLPNGDINATPEEIPAKHAQVGDFLLVRVGDRIPLDGVIVSGESRLDTSALTGEAKPIAVRPKDEVLSGCLNTVGQLVMQVSRPLAESTVSRILRSVENAAEGKPQIDRFITRFARIYTPIVVLLAVLVAAVPPLLFNGDFAYWLKTALTFLVISCPCALVLSVPLAYFAGIGAASRRGILFKSGLAMENINRLKAIAFDKTGTLTHGNFEVQNIVPVNGISAENLLKFAAAAEKGSTHPIAASILQAAEAAEISCPHAIDIKELSGLGIAADIDGSHILCGNARLMQKFAIDIPEYKTADGVTEVLLAKDGVFIGHIEIADTPKEDAPQAIGALKRLGLTACMLTGDTERTAHAVARLCGIDEVHARLLPQDKLDTLVNLRKQHGSVMFVGDGINDAPVLAGADIGAAMGSGSDAAIEAADVVFMNSNMSAVPEAISIARSANRIAWQNVVFALAVKAAIMLIGLQGSANMWLAVFADTGVAMLCLLNSVRILYRR